MVLYYPTGRGKKTWEEVVSPAVGCHLGSISAVSRVQSLILRRGGGGDEEGGSAGSLFRTAAGHRAKLPSEKLETGRGRLVAGGYNVKTTRRPVHGVVHGQTWMY